MGRDVTERREAERAALEARHVSEAANRAKSLFLANMSHELRTPLNAILGFSEIIRDGVFGAVGVPRYAEYARDIHDSGQHLLDLISDILDLSKIEAGKLDVTREWLDAGAILQTCVRMTKVRAAEARLRLALNLPVRGGLELYADERAAKQILFNLLSNAIKFTPPGGRILVSGFRCPEGGTECIVSDTGIGIPEEKLDLVLRPFEQIDNRYNRRGGGTGLGLALVGNLAALHGGRLSISSRIGVGTSVHVWFPPGPARASAPDARVA